MDSSGVLLTVPKEYESVVDEIYISHSHKAEYAFSSGNGLTSFQFYDVIDGKLAYLDELVDLGIPFDSEWDRGLEYSQGVTHNRYSPEGFQINHSSTEFRWHIKPEEIKKILSAGGGIAQKLHAFYQLVAPYDKYIQETKWDNQVQYGKLFLMNKLLRINKE